MKKNRSFMIVLWLMVCMPIVCYAGEQKLSAAFAFTKTAFQVNEPVEVTLTSTVPEGSKITKSEWMCTIKGKQQTSSNIKSLLQNAPTGQYTVYLRIKDNKGSWSSWTSQKVSIVQAKPIVLKGFAGSKAAYDIGEKLNLNYTYDNPNDLDIIGERWRYRNLTTGGAVISGKPKYFKKAGTYEITLEVQDEWGNWSNKLSCQVKVDQKIIERNGYYLFEKGTPGDLIEGYIDKDYNYFDEAVVMERTDVEGVLLMSNSPETIYSSGLLYQDSVSGKGRLILHHLNGTSYAKKLLVTVTNPGSSQVRLTISNNAVLGPSRHILQLGQASVLQYLKGTQDKTYTIEPGQTICIYSSMPSGVWKKDEAVSGTLDFVSSGRLTFKVAALDEKSAMENIAKLAPLKKDSHDRGTFNIIGRQYTLDLRNITQLKKLVIGREEEEWLKGKDAMTGEEAWNRGNYGVPVNITVLNNEDIGVVVNARGGAYLGALKWNGSQVFKVPGEQVLKSQQVAALAGNIKQGQSCEIVYMLPNGSSAPVLFGFIPKSAWK